MGIIKNFKELGLKEFFKRWKKGIDGITPLQQTNSQITFTYIVITGLILGIIFAIISIKSLYWLMIILLGGLGNTIIQLIALRQKKNLLIVFENSCKEVENEQKSTI